MNATEIIKSLTDLQSRAERAEALLADERNRVANLERELAARPVVTEETVQAMAHEFWRTQMTCSSGERLTDILRRHLLPPAPPEPEPVPVGYQPEPEPIPEGVHWDEKRKGFQMTHGLHYAGSFYEKWHSRRHEFPQSREEAERRGKPDEVMRLIDKLEYDYTVRCGVIYPEWRELRKAITKEREAGR